MFLFVLSGCSKKKTGSEVNSKSEKTSSNWQAEEIPPSFWEELGVEPNDPDTLAKIRKIRVSMQKSIDKWSNLTPLQLEAIQKKLQEENTQTREKAISDLIKKIDEIMPGVTAQKVEDAFNSIGKHQFTIKSDQKTYTCYSYRAGENYWAKRAAKYYCMYEENKLYSIIDVPQFEYDYVPYRGGSREITKPVDPDKRIKKCFDSDNLLSNGLVKSLKERFPKKSSSSNLGPLVGFSNSEAPSALKAKEQQRRARLEEKYNSAKIKIGMDKFEVIQILGRPKWSRENDKKRVCIYGEDVTFNYHPKSFEWIAIEYINDKVDKVLRRDFFDKRLLK